MIANGIGSELALDANALAALRRQAREDPKAGLKQASQQFEALFLQMMLKAMRESVPRGGMLDGDAGRMYEGLLDQQLAQVLAGRAGTGLAAAIERQLGAQLAAAPASGANGAAKQAAASGAPQPGPAPAAQPRRGEAPPPPVSASGAPAQAREFVDRLWPHAEQASRETGIPARFLIAQAALETGWGRSELRLPDGSPSHNLFNLKAGRGWAGASVEAQTTEYVAGSPVRQAERFRAYASYAEAFADYARLIRSRYAAALGAREPAAFAGALQAAGYATDPAYAVKLTRIIEGATLRSGLAG
ncbi:MAG: flagellar assembly peptidoglycan hydrolase FlgJ [Rhodocyclaceae bacterium]